MVWVTFVGHEPSEQWLSQSRTDRDSHRSPKWPTVVSDLWAIARQESVGIPPRFSRSHVETQEILEGTKYFLVSDGKAIARLRVRRGRCAGGLFGPLHAFLRFGTYAGFDVHNVRVPEVQEFAQIAVRRPGQENDHNHNRASVSSSQAVAINGMRR